MVVNDKYYEIDSKQYDRVTIITKYVSPGIYNNIPVKTLENARERGVAMHGYFAQLLKGKLSKSMIAGIKKRDPSTYDNVLLLEDWIKSNIKKVIMSEKPIYCDKLGIAGTPDMIAININDNVIMPDLKNTSAIYKSHIVQLAGYNIIARSNKIEIDNFYILQLTGGKLKTIDVTNSIGKAETLFMYALALHRSVESFGGEHEG